MSKIKVVISGGGTGGHIFPALSIADEIKRRCPDAEILFVGANNRMEMDKVPAAGYPIIGLDIAGFDRKKIWKNIGVVLKLRKSLNRARQVLKDFNPDITIGVGGYASGPTLKQANRLGIPTLLQEQNSYAGLTNKILAKKAEIICVAYSGMEEFFPLQKIVLTGNPCRKNLLNETLTRVEAAKFFNLDPAKKTIFVTGGSLGSKTLNDSILAGLQMILKNDIQIIWQSGSYYYKEMKDKIAGQITEKDVKLLDFVSRMDLAYKLADVVVSRAGAGAISELALLGKATILVPSPNVAEDHQTKNAQALVKKDAAILIKDCDARDILVGAAVEIVKSDQRIGALSANIKKLAYPNATEHIVDEVMKIINK